MYRPQSQSIVSQKVTSEARRRPGFTLIELVVSIGILVLMIAVAGTVFSLTLESTGQAKALMTVNERLRALEQNLREDLRCVRRGGSQLVIQAHEVNAYWTAVQKELDADPLTGPFPRGGDPERMRVDWNESDATQMIKPQPPRADVLMFFTNRPGTSYVFVTPPVESSLQLVTYGHADLDELNADGTWRWNPNDTALDRWDIRSGDLASSPYRVPAAQWHLFRRPVMVVNREVPGSATYTPGTGLLTSQAELVTGETDVLFMAAQNPGAFTQFALPIPAAAYARSELDVTPPSVLAGRSGAYFLPNCASFKVEWTFADPVLDDLPETLWVDPANTVLVTGDAHNPGQLQRMAQQYFPDPDDPKRHYLEGGLPEYLPNRIVGSFDTGDLGPMHYWSPAGVEPAKDAFYPTALRITVDAFDEAGRFERPIRHVMVIPVGS